MAFGGGKAPKKTPEEKALEAAQTRQLDQTEQEINDRKRRILRSEIGGRGSLLSGSERGVRPGETRLGPATTAGGSSGKSGVPRKVGVGSLAGGGSGSFAGRRYGRRGVQP